MTIQDLKPTVIAELNCIEKAISRAIDKYLHISAGVYLDYDFKFTAAWHCMSYDNDYVKDYASELAFKVYRYDDETDEFIEDPLAWHRLIKLENKLENLFDAREKLIDKYGWDILYTEEKSA